MTDVGARRGTSTVVRSGGHSTDYPVLVGRGLLDSLPALLEEYAPAHRYAVICDSNVAELYGGRVLRLMEEARLGTELFSFPSGERHKTRVAWAETDRRAAEGRIRPRLLCGCTRRRGGW